MDDRVYNAVKRFMSPSQIEAAYESIFLAYQQRLADVTVITQKSSEGESVNAQVVVNREDFLEWMEALEQLMKEQEGTAACGPVHTNFNSRYTET